VSSSSQTGASSSTRQAGQYGREEIRRRLVLAIAGLALLLLVAAAVGASAGLRSPVFIAAELAVIAVMLTAARPLFASLDRRVRGVEGEELVGSALDALQSDGWLALHDVQTGRGNIDHVAIGPGGLIAIETKSHGGRRSVDRIDPAWLRQSYAQKCWLERVTNTKADGLLVFSRAYLDRHISRRNGVLVLPARSLARELRRRRPVLTSDEVAVLHAKLCAALDGAGTP
jgi:hypothetical protein